jgi:hypothetical protein
MLAANHSPPALTATGTARRYTLSLRGLTTTTRIAGFWASDPGTGQN